MAYKGYKNCTEHRFQPSWSSNHGDGETEVSSCNTCHALKILWRLDVLEDGEWKRVEVERVIEPKLENF